jgi:uncharacterized membrane-anchored protein
MTSGHHVTFRRLLFRAATTLALPFSILSGAAAADAPAPPEPPAIDWVVGPAAVDLGDVARIQVPEGYRFTAGDGTRKILEMMHNPTSGAELGLIVPETAEDENPWFVIFEFDAMGYVKDDDKSKLDADAILKSLREGQEEGNKERQKRGWDPLNIDGWKVSPFYNESTHNLEWAVLVSSSKHQSVNYSTRVLGRKGVMRVDLVLDPEQLATAQSSYQSLLTSFAFQQGETYAEFRKGDKIAEMGLIALVAGGAGAIAAKSGLLAKFWKLIILAAVGLGAGIKRLWNKIVVRNEETIAGPPVPPSGQA